ncbi:MAG: PepSY domain-containing protein [Burkholderiales bacterium]|jgi:hypothetical protein|nr:PepSY domain-containing protein [Burkholderiales bacterium]
MKRLLATAILAAFAGAAFAHGNVSCPVVPKEEKKPQMELQKKLESEGWKVRVVKNYNGCYEVYGFDATGAKAEAFFHPKTFERVYPEDQQAASAPK